MLNWNAAKAVQAKKQTGAVTDSKGPSIRIQGVIEGDAIVIRVPLKYTAAELRETDPKKSGSKNPVATPYASLVVELPESAEVVVSNGDDKLSVYTRTRIAFNLFMGWSPMRSTTSDDTEE